MVNSSGSIADNSSSGCSDYDKAQKFNVGKNLDKAQKQNQTREFNNNNNKDFTVKPLKSALKNPFNVANHSESQSLQQNPRGSQALRQQQHLATNPNIGHFKEEEDEEKKKTPLQDKFAVRFLQNLDLRRKEKQESNNEFRKIAKMIVNVISLENEVIQKKNNEWGREEFGGVKVWVNRENGDVSLDNPLQTLQTVHLKSRRKSSANLMNSGYRYSISKNNLSEGISMKGKLKKRNSSFPLELKRQKSSFILPVSGQGMGSDFYDPTEAQELFDILDQCKNPYRDEFTN